MVSPLLQVRDVVALMMAMQFTFCSNAENPRWQRPGYDASVPVDGDVEVPPPGPGLGSGRNGALRLRQTPPFHPPIFCPAVEHSDRRHCCLFTTKQGSRAWPAWAPALPSASPASSRVGSTRPTTRPCAPTSRGPARPPTPFSAASCPPPPPSSTSSARTALSRLRCVFTRSARPTRPRRQRRMPGPEVLGGERKATPLTGMIFEPSFCRLGHASHKDRLTCLPNLA